MVAALWFCGLLVLGFLVIATIANIRWWKELRKMTPEQRRKAREELYHDLGWGG
jgi:hypothetical protein